MPRLRLSSKSNPADFIRMFVLVRTDIPYEHQTVQALHAGMQYVEENPLTIPFNRDCHERNCHDWCFETQDLDFMYDEQYVGQLFKWTARRGTAVCLAVDNELELIKWGNKLNAWGVKNSMFTEPDWTDREVPTALACLGFKGDFPTLPLLKMPKGFFASKCKSEPLDTSKF
jgi:hypothetical protein